MDNTKKDELKDKFLQETRELIFLTVYLTLFLNALAIYRRLLLEEPVFSYFHIGYNFIEALAVGKIILLGKMLKLGERYANKALIIPVIYKAAVFSVFIFFFSVLEHFVFAIIQGKDVASVWSELIHQGLNEILSRLIIAFLMLILLFSFLEISRVFGEEQIFKLFFRRNKGYTKT